MRPPLNGAYFQSPSRSNVAVVVLHGSEGERRDALAQRFADAGFSALAINYFGIPGRSERHRRGTGRVRGGRCAMAARANAGADRSRRHSKGAELALIAAALLDHPIIGVIGWAPSSVAWYGVDVADPASRHLSTWAEARQRSSWSLRGEPLPYVRFPAGVLPEPTPRGLVVRSCYEVPLEDEKAVANASIPIESACRTLLVSGGDDQLWPSRRMGDMLVERSRSRGGPPVRHLVYPAAGHLITPDRAGRSSELLAVGGTPEADTAAAATSFRAAADFLGAL